MKENVVVIDKKVQRKLAEIFESLAREEQAIRMLRREMTK